MKFADVTGFQPLLASLPFLPALAGWAGMVLRRWSARQGDDVGECLTCGGTYAFIGAYPAIWGIHLLAHYVLIFYTALTTHMQYWMSHHLNRDSKRQGEHTKGVVE